MKRKESLFFTGIKHSGKTTFAKAIAERWNWKFVDSDDLISGRLNGTSIRDFYKNKGKNYFMALEREAVVSFVENENNPFILSLGGGVSDNTKLMEDLKNTGYIIYLERDEKDILPIILKDGIPPFLDDNNVEDSFHQLYIRRDSIYKEYADLTIFLGSYGDKKEIEDKIDSGLKENGYGV